MISYSVNKSNGKKSISIFNFSRHYKRIHKKSSSIENSGEGTSGTAGVVAMNANLCTELEKQLTQVLTQNEDLKKNGGTTM